MDGGAWWAAIYGVAQVNWSDLAAAAAAMAISINNKSTDNPRYNVAIAIHKISPLDTPKQLITQISFWVSMHLTPQKTVVKQWVHTNCS